MVVAEHQLVKPEVLVKTAVGLLESELLLPRTFAREGIDRFRGAKDDTVTFKVPGVLPYHEYAWRNDRSQPIEFDEYAETKFPITFGGNVYSAVQVTDEQNEMDLDGWSTLLTPQAEAVAAGIEAKCVKQVKTAPYEVTIGGAGGNLRGATLEARRVLNAFKVPGARTLLVGSDFEMALLEDDKITLAQNAGDAIANQKLTEATLGRLSGFNVVRCDDLAPGEAMAYVPSAFALITAAPSVPSSIKLGGTTSYGGFAIRWLRDYDPTRFVERSVLNAFAGTDVLKDLLKYRIQDGTNAGQIAETSERHLVRAIRLTLDGKSDYPAAGSELDLATGKQVNDSKVWTPTGRKAESAQA